MVINNNVAPLGARDIALKAIEAYRRKKVWPDFLLKTFFEKYNIPQKDIALIWRIVGGVIQNMMLLDYYINFYSNIPLNKIHPTARDILRLSFYQIIFLDKIPYSAAVNQGVELAKKYLNPSAVKFVNAVLRKTAKDKQDNCLPEVKADTDLEKLSIKFSHPKWLVDEFIRALGIDETEALLEMNNSDEVAVFAQVNTLHAVADDVFRTLKDNDIDVVSHEWLEDCFELRGAGDVTKLSAFRDGLVYVQDPASRLAIVASGVKSGDLVIDACSAPGGKAFAAAIAMEKCGKILAYDNKLSKVQEIKRGAARLGIDIIKASQKDSTETADELIGVADVVLADVPCSGFGVIRKKPEIRYKSKESIIGLPEKQLQILSNVAKYVKPGGVLLYSTCTVLKCENEDVVSSFLQVNSDFSAEGFALSETLNAPAGMITLWPHRNKTDGFFMCKLRRNTDI